MAEVSTVLTWREGRVFRFIVRHIDDYGYAPTIREIGDEVGLSSTSSVSYVLSRLVDKGYITRLWGRQSIMIDPVHSGRVMVNRDDLAALIKLVGSETDAAGPVARLMDAAHL